MRRLLFLACASMAWAQNTPVSVTLTTNGFVYGCCGSESGETTGTIAPFPGTFSISFGVQGAHMSLTMYFSANNASGVGDMLQFDDYTAHVGGGVSGTARLAFGTGAFNGATGTLAYAYTCLVTDPGTSCLEQDDSPLQDPNTITLNGTGTIYVPAAAAGLVQPGGVTPPPPPPGATLGSYHSGTNIGIVNSIYQNLTSGGGGQARHTEAASATSQTSLTITPPMAPVATAYSVATSCPGVAGDCWIPAQATPTLTIPAFTVTPISVVLSPESETATGVYPGNVSLTLTPSGSAPVVETLPMNLIVAPAGPYLALPQTGLQITGYAAGGSPISEQLAVMNQGAGPMAYSMAVSTLSGGNWLSATGGPGSVAASASANITVQANPAGLQPGIYFGRVDVIAPGAMASPQSIFVAFNILPATTVSAPLIAPSGLIFVTNAGTNPPPGTFQVTLPVNAPTESGGVTVSVPPGSFFSVLSPGYVPGNLDFPIQINASASGLTAGVYEVPISTQVLGTTYTVRGVMIVKPAGACTPTRLVPVFTSPYDGFTTAAGLPVSVQAQVVDDCGTPMTNGAVTASFSTDPAISLVPTGNGAWSGTWTPSLSGGGEVNLSLKAYSYSASISGIAGLSGTVSAQAAPVITPGGVVSAASIVENAPIAPASFISIFGSNLADAPTPATSFPFPTKLGGAQVLIAGQPAPLSYAGPGQINAVVPFGTPAVNLEQLVVSHGGLYSPPQTLAVATTQPAVFTQNQTGSGPGAILVIKSDGTEFLNTASAPASAGDSLAIYCAGLGPVLPPVADGAAAPASPLSQTTLPVSVTIGGQNAQVLFSGLAPGFAGLYQVNAVVPAGVAAGSSAPVVVTAGGFSSPPVTIAIQ